MPFYLLAYILFSVGAQIYNFQWQRLAFSKVSAKSHAGSGRENVGN
jgi:hypothetical protein